MNVEFTIPKLPGFVARMTNAERIVRDEMRTGIDRLTLQGERAAKQRAAVRTGHLRRSITHEPARFAGGTVTGRFGTATPYARYVEFGRGPVVAASGKVLRFEIGGQVFYRKRVGPARAQPFMRPAADQVRRIAPREMQATIRRIVARLEA